MNDEGFKSFKQITVLGDSEGRTFSFDGWEPHTPRTNKEIWRYRNLEHYISILENNHLWFSRPDQFEDPFEGSLPRKNVEERHEKYDSTTKEGRAAVRFYYRFTAFLNCWYNEEHESDAMWRLYSKKGNSLAIKSTPHKLKQAMEHSEDAEFGEVEYHNYNNYKIRTNNPIAPLFYKREVFEFEKEFRVLLHYTNPDINGESITNIGKFQPNGVPVSVDVETMIDEVVVSPTASKDFIERVESVTKSHGYNFDINKSEMYGNPHF